MNIDDRYLENLVKPLEGKVGLTPKEYISAISDLGIAVTEASGKIDRKFKLHLLHAVSSGYIQNDRGTKLLDDFGLTLSGDGYISLVNNRVIKKGNSFDNATVNVGNVINNVVNVGGSFNGILQAGDSNSATSNTTSAPHKSSAVSWIMDNIVGVVVSGLILIVVATWLGLKP